MRRDGKPLTLVVLSQNPSAATEYTSTRSISLKLTRNHVLRISYAGTPADSGCTTDSICVVATSRRRLRDPPFGRSTMGS